MILAVAANNNMASITQAFAMDLTGQVCVDQFEGQFYGGLSTQAAFMRGSALSPGGKPIFCLASTTETGASRIKPMLETGDGVGIQRSDVHYVVTEFGIAYLFGKSIRERALAMIEVAHPDHRDNLVEKAKQLGYVPSNQYLASRHAYAVQEERRLTPGQRRRGADTPDAGRRCRCAPSPLHHLSPDDVYTRFFRRVRSLSYEDLQAMCNVNHATQVAFLAVTGPRENEVVVASACYFLNSTSNLAEVAYMVAPAWQGLGLGKALQVRLREFAMARGVRGFIAEILANNERMVRLAASATGDTTTTREDDTLQVTTLFSETGQRSKSHAEKNRQSPQPSAKPSAPRRRDRPRRIQLVGADGSFVCA